MDSKMSGVRQRLERECFDKSGVPWFTATVIGDDLRALLADHARLQADAARWAAIAPNLSVDWDESDHVPFCLWLELRSGSLMVTDQPRHMHSNVTEAADILVAKAVQS